jgi:transcriptional regulator with XRE-family HTH domain
MNATVGCMTLQDLLKQYGISTIRELTHRTGLSRQQCWNLWHAQAGVGKETLKRLHERLNIPLEDLLQVDPVPRRKREARESSHLRKPRQASSKREQKRGKR